MLDHLPNLLTLFRIACVPVVAALLSIDAQSARLAACALFAVAALTDWLDGYAARRLQRVSLLGRMLDPIADKLLVATVLLMLVAVGSIDGVSIIAALAILLREILISGVREFRAGAGLPGLPVTVLAKWKTTVQLVAFGLLMIGDQAIPGLPLHDAGIVVLWVAAVLTLVTGFEYLVGAIRQLAGARRNPPQDEKREA